MHIFGISHIVSTITVFLQSRRDPVLQYGAIHGKIPIHWPQFRLENLEMWNVWQGHGHGPRHPLNFGVGALKTLEVPAIGAFKNWNRFFWCPLYYIHKRTPQNSIGNHAGTYMTGRRYEAPPVGAGTRRDFAGDAFRPASPAWW